MQGYLYHRLPPQPTIYRSDGASTTSSAVDPRLTVVLTNSPGALLQFSSLTRPFSLSDRIFMTSKLQDLPQQRVPSPCRGLCRRQDDAVPFIPQKNNVSTFSLKSKLISSKTQKQTLEVKSTICARITSRHQDLRKPARCPLQHPSPAKINRVPCAWLGDLRTAGTNGHQHLVFHEFRRPKINVTQGPLLPATCIGLSQMYTSFAFIGAYGTMLTHHN